jgi:hypothetical protein
LASWTTESRNAWADALNASNGFGASCAATARGAEKESVVAQAITANGFMQELESVEAA